MTFVCESCKGKPPPHPDCPGGTWCDCGHKIPQGDADE